MRRNDFTAIAHICNSERDERSWHFLKLGMDTILTANWYRPGATVHDSFASLYSEMSDHFNSVSGTCIAGDLNVHHRKWLRHSNANTQVGTDLKSFCDYHGLIQIVREPTRQEYLLDLAVTDIHGASSEVMPKIADHKGVLIKLPLTEVLESRTVREM